MILHIFECSKCQRQQKHVTSTPSPLGLSYMSECATCDKVRTFKFIREGNRKEDWYTNTLLQVKRKQSENQSDKARRKNDDLDQVAI